MKKKLFLLIKYVAKIFKIPRKDSANLLLTLFSNYNVFTLPDNKQKLIIENLILYFRSLVFGIDKLEINKNIRNKYLSDTDILEHLDSKIQDLVINCKYIKY